MCQTTPDSDLSTLPDVNCSALLGGVAYLSPQPQAHFRRSGLDTESAHLIYAASRLTSRVCN
jgi:hypothetical protein